MSDTPKTNKAWRLRTRGDEYGSIVLDDQRYKASAQLERDLTETRFCLAALMAELPNCHVRHENPDLWQRCAACASGNNSTQNERDCGNDTGREGAGNTSPHRSGEAERKP